MIGQGDTDSRTYDRERLYGNSNILYEIAAGKHLHCLWRCLILPGTAKRQRRKGGYKKIFMYRKPCIFRKALS